MRHATFWQRISRYVAIGALSAIGLLAIAGLAGARFNLTASLPKGLYWVIDRPIARDAYVMFCPPSSGAFVASQKRGYVGTGYCPNGYAPLLKKVSGVGGDNVSVGKDAIAINGRVLPLSARSAVDGAGRPLPQPFDRYVLNDAQLWVMSDTNPKSFDSRYFGPIEKQWVTAVVRPVMTWGYGGTLPSL